MKINDKDKWTSIWDVKITDFKYPDGYYPVLLPDKIGAMTPAQILDNVGWISFVNLNMPFTYSVPCELEGIYSIQRILEKLNKEGYFNES